MGNETPIGAKLEVLETNTGISMDVDPEIQPFSGSWTDTVSIGSRNAANIDTVHIPKIWAPGYFFVDADTTVNVLVVSYIQYAGFVVDYSIQMQDGSQSSRTGTVWATFDQGLNCVFNEQTTADIGDTSFVTIDIINSGSTILRFNNYGTVDACYVYISARLLPRFNNQNPF
jgi:hypothetical protein